MYIKVEMVDSNRLHSFFPLIKDYKPEPVSYECQWSGDWQPVPGCAIEVDVSYSGTSLNLADGKGADRQKDAYACQALCRARNNTYFRWVSPEFNHTLYPNAVPFSCFCKNEITARKMKPGSISGAANNCSSGEIGKLGGLIIIKDNETYPCQFKSRALKKFRICRMNLCL